MTHLREQLQQARVDLTKEKKKTKDLTERVEKLKEKEEQCVQLTKENEEAKAQVEKMKMHVNQVDQKQKIVIAEHKKIEEERDKALKEMKSAIQIQLQVKAQRDQANLVRDESLKKV